MAVGIVSVDDVLDGHVALDLECLDRVYLNAYVPKLQVAGQVVTFMKDHLGMPIPSPAVMERIGNRFRDAVKRFAAARRVPVVRFVKGDRHIDVMRPYLERAARPGVVAIGAAQEFQSVWTGYRRRTDNGAPLFGFVKADRRVSVFYFYIWDDEFGPGFIKLASYFPYPGKVWLNGHVRHEAP